MKDKVIDVFLSAPFIVLGRLILIAAAIIIGFLSNEPFAFIFREAGWGYPTLFDFLGWPGLFVIYFLFPITVILSAAWCFHQIHTTTEMFRPLAILFSIVFLGSAISYNWLPLTILTFVFLRFLYNRLPSIALLGASERNL